ncbi:protein CYSTEINE-RICH TRANSMEMBRANE MODULE 11-like isoform X1 [Andrographis paniculata]|uniref:protein CYSTEINE-RICH TRANSMEMBRANE MODULE 11-like isoform X1 n=1 Tax=Andrographis paniculata TaxID=175694 RepID=UPI0021E77B4D|nr:protein CYSTEINE-RICH TRANSMEMBRANE MODULE 11-like isoform X1 [Andrographis paniculata]
MNEAPKYASPYPAHGQYEGPPVMAPPQYYAAPPPSRKPGLLEGWFGRGFTQCALLGSDCGFLRYKKKEKIRQAMFTPHWQVSVPVTEDIHD